MILIPGILVLYNCGGRDWSMATCSWSTYMKVDTFAIDLELDTAKNCMVCSWIRCRVEWTTVYYV